MTENSDLQRPNALSQVANEYREEGYEVTISPTLDQLPDFLHPFQIDMLAHNGDENVVIEVRTRSSLTHSPRLDEIATIVEEQKQWRIDLVVNPEKVTIQLGVPLNIEDIKYRLQEAHELSEKEHGEAALLLTWSTLEALLRRGAQAEQVPLEQHDSPLYLIKSLFTYGLLDREQYQILKSGAQARDTIMHGYKKQQSFAEILNELLSLADHLVDSPLPA